MEELIKIDKHEDKTSKDGKDYTRFNCVFENNASKWMSAFETDVIASLKSNENEWIIAEVAQSGDYWNIRKFVGLPDGKQEVTKPTSTGSTTVNSSTSSSEYTPTTMYISYAKDIFIELHTVDAMTIQSPDLMSLAIELVKQAHEAFK